jgi:hypothetical protein
LGQRLKVSQDVGQRIETPLHGRQVLNALTVRLGEKVSQEDKHSGDHAGIQVACEERSQMRKDLQRSEYAEEKEERSGG